MSIALSMLRALRPACALALATVLLSTHALPARAADKINMRLDWLTHVMHLPIYLAIEKGWFKAADLDVTVEDGNGSVTTVQLVGSGEQFDIGLASLSSMAVGRGTGIPVISLAGYLPKSPLGVIYADNIGVKTLKDLVGKKIVYTPGSFEAPFLEPFFKQNGIAMTDLNLIGVAAPAKITSFTSGAADAFVTTVPGDMPHTKGKRGAAGLLFADYGMNLPTFGLFTRTEALKTKGPAIKRFVSVISASWTYILDGHAAEAAAATMKQKPRAPTSQERLMEEFENYEPFFHADKAAAPPGWQTAQAWDETIKEMEVAKVIPAGTKPEQYFTNDYTDAAYGKKIVEGK